MATTGTLAARLVADTAVFQANMQEAANISERELARAGRAVKYVNDYLKETDRLQKMAMGPQAGQQIAANADHMDRMAHSSAGVNRELLVLAHELSQGNYKRFGGSLLVLAEQTDALSKIMTPVGAAIGAATVAVGGFLVAVAAGAIAQSEFNNALKMTGNAAGLTQASFDQLAAAAAASTNSTIRSSKSAVEELVKSGRFGSDVIGIATQAVLNMERISGQSSEEIVKDFAKMGDGVAKWAQEHNRSSHFLTTAEFARIKQLEDAGHAEDAARETLRLLSNQVAQSSEEVGTLAKAWHGVKNAVSDAVDAMMNVGKAESDLEKMAKLQATLAQLNADAQAAASNPLAGKLGDRASYYGPQREAVQAEIANLREKMKFEQQAADLKAHSARESSKGIDAIMAAPKLDANAYQAILRDIQKYNEGTAEAASYTGKASAADHWAAEMRAKLNGETVKLTATQRQAVAGAIQAAHDWAAATEAENAARSQRIARIVQDTAEDEKQHQKLVDLVSAGHAYTASIIEQTDALGKTADELELLTAQRKIDADTQKALAGASAETVAEVYRMADYLGKEAIDAIKDRQARAKALSGSWDFGGKTAVQQYGKDAADNAKHAEDLVKGSLSRMEDMWVNLAKTGKLSMSDLFGYVAEQILRLSFQKGVTALLGDGGGLGSLLGSIGGIFGGPGHASGLQEVPYDGFPTVLHKGERVLSAAQARTQSAQAGGGVVLDFRGQVLNVGAGVNRAEMAAALRLSQSQTVEHVRRLQRQGVMAA